jgi:hypothetical protein
MIAEIAKWLIVGMLCLGGLLTVASVGKPRRTLTGGQAAASVAFNALYVTLIVLYWRNA